MVMAEDNAISWPFGTPRMCDIFLVALIITLSLFLPRSCCSLVVVAMGP